MLKWDTKFWLWTKTTKEVQPVRYNNSAKQNTSTANGIFGLFLGLFNDALSITNGTQHKIVNDRMIINWKEYGRTQLWVTYF
jgi:hypothetical protein